MVTATQRSYSDVPEGKSLISFEEAMDVLSRDERFKATVYAMNTLLVSEEFEFHFRQWAQKAKK